MLTAACRGTVRRLRLLRCVHFAIRYKIERFRARFDAAVAVILDLGRVPLVVGCEYLETRVVIRPGHCCSWVTVVPHRILGRIASPEHRAVVSSDW